MQLSGPEIQKRMSLSFLASIANIFGADIKPDIVIRPFDPECLGSNSYDIHLADTLKTYKNTIPEGMIPWIPYDESKFARGEYSMRDWFVSDEYFEDYKLNPWKYDTSNPQFALNPKDCDKKTISTRIPETGLIISEKFGYLGSNVEWTETRNLFPYIDGKSSTGRLFMSNHQTAGRGDDNFRGFWTLEITCKAPVILIPNMRIGQIYYDKFIGKRKPYGEKSTAHYQDQAGAVAAAALQIGR
jgi:dCTP deaminase